VSVASSLWGRLFGRRRTESRAITSVPWDSGDPLSYVATQDRALTLVPVYAAVRLLADTISTLPLKAYRKSGDERQPMGGLPQLFAQLDDDGSLTDWLHRAVASLALQGNAVGYVTARDGMQFPTGIEWLAYSQVYCDESRPTAPKWYWQGRYIPSEDIVHIPWFTVPGKVLGLSPIAAYAATVDVGLQAQIYGSSWFASGGVPPGTFKSKTLEIDQSQADIISARLTKAIRQRKTLVYGADWEYSAQTVPPEQAQFIATQKLTATQIAAIYGIPPEMIGGEAGGSLTYNTIEQNTTNLATLTLRPWLVKLERKFSSILPSKQYVKFNADALIRADLTARMNAYKVADEIGLYTDDEMRAMEDRPPLTASQKAEITAGKTPPPAPAAAPPQANGQPASREQLLDALILRLLEDDYIDGDVVPFALEGRPKDWR
jgi:HK97 family phage portal protein